MDHRLRSGPRPARALARPCLGRGRGGVSTTAAGNQAGDQACPFTSHGRTARSAEKSHAPGTGREGAGQAAVCGRELLRSRPPALRPRRLGTGEHGVIAGEHGNNGGHEGRSCDRASGVPPAAEAGAGELLDWFLAWFRLEAAWRKANLDFLENKKRSPTSPHTPRRASRVSESASRSTQEVIILASYGSSHRIVRTKSRYATTRRLHGGKRSGRALLRLSKASVTQ